MQFVFSFKMSPLLWVLLGVIAVGCLRYFRFWCRCFCPAGAFVSLFNHVALFDRPARRRRNVRRCEVGMNSVRNIDCLRCNRCLAEPIEARKDGRAWDLPALVFVTLLLIILIVDHGLTQTPRTEASAAPSTIGATQPAPAEGPPVAPQGRPVDAKALELGMRSGLIADREAMYYHKQRNADGSRE